MIDYFVIGHDISKYESTDSCHSTFIEIGTKRSQHNQNTIRCIDLPHNIEQYRYLCAFTGWYAIAKNFLYNNKYVCLLEYDTKVLANLHQSNIKALTTNPKAVIAYSYTQMDHYVFTKSTPWLEISLKKIYNLDLQQFVSDYRRQFPFWPTTTNLTIGTDVLEQFIRWFEPMCELFRHYELGAYVQERAFFVFCVIHNIPITYCLNTVYHQQQKSHGITDIYGLVLKQYNAHGLKDNMKPIYDQIYNQELDKAMHQLQKYER